MNISIHIHISFHKHIYTFKKANTCVAYIREAFYGVRNSVGVHAVSEVGSVLLI